ncbi:MAG: hypothetical protein A2283_18715 [Lentisphaerae bacterium RIFOXYA12_FULL_48_11]|nr:MAG: hypothetical protein A2283_18715 [Lentisphaerae bacterium RIFOXYA12_FULL_48_11]
MIKSGIAFKRIVQMMGCVWVTLCLSVLVSPVRATIIVGEIDWNTPETSSTFSSQYGSTVVDYPSTGGSPSTGGWMRIEFPETTSEPGTDWYDVLRVPATNLFTGSWDTQMWVQFDFWQSNLVAGAVQIRWGTTNAGAGVWRSPVTIPSGLDTWTTVASSFNNWQNWQYPGATEAQYLADLQNIDWVGVYIFRNTGDEQIYGIDNFRLMIPEPAELLMLVSAVLASGLSARRRRRRKYPG